MAPSIVPLSPKFISGPHHKVGDVLKKPQAPPRWSPSAPEESWEFHANHPCHGIGIRPVIGSFAPGGENVVRFVPFPQGVWKLSMVAKVGPL